MRVDPQRPWNLIFCGSAPFAIPALEALLESGDDVRLVVASPPAKAGRGRALASVPVAARAREKGLPLLETATPNAPESVATLAATRPDLVVVCALGSFLGPGLLALGKFPPVNLHPSLLPRHRGPAPINWAIIEGDAATGVTVIALIKEMDAGPILGQRKFPLDPTVTAPRLEKAMAAEGAALLLETIAAMKRNEIVPRPQDGRLATIDRLLVKKDGHLDFREPAEKLARLINGLEPWPGAAALLNGRLVQFFEATAQEGPSAPGAVHGLNEAGSLLIGAGDGTVAVAFLRPEGKKRLSAAEFLRGYRPSSFASLAL
ncbi:MAG: methionyl-tRNA formyltransferase [Deltaproteobacteria bacterium]|nr:methionyl-tRNA formyltransferase [Deltaproteobacteria bacterium]